MNSSTKSQAEKFNVGIIGFGKLGLLHAGIVNGLAGSRLAAVADPSSTMLNFLRSKLTDVGIYSDYKKMLEKENLSAVFVATPTGTHVPIALECVRAGIPFFLEKPMAATAAQARELVKALEKRPVVNMVGYMGRYIDTFRQAKGLIDTQALGRLQMLRSSMYMGQLFKSGKGWRYDKSVSGGGVLITQNAHLIDKLLWFFGHVDSVSGHIQSLYSESTEDHAHAYFVFKNGLNGFLDASWSARHYRTVTISIHVQGEFGTLDVDDDNVRLFLEKPHGDLPAGWSTWRKPDLYQGVSFDIGGPQYTREAEEFFAALSGQGRVDSDVMSAYQTQCVIEAIYRSANRHGAPVSVDEVVSNG